MGKVLRVPEEKQAQALAGVKKKSKKEKLCSFEFGLRQGEGCKQNCVVVLPY